MKKTNVIIWIISLILIIHCNAFAFVDDFSSSTLDPQWNVSSGIGSYSLTDNPGYLRYNLLGPRSHIDDDISGFWNPSMNISRSFTGTDWVMETEINYNLRWSGTGSQIPHMEIISENSADKYIWIERTIDQAYNANYIEAGIHDGSSRHDYYTLPTAPDDVVSNDWLKHTYWYRVERNGDNITARYSSDGTNYTDMFSSTLPANFGDTQKVNFDGLAWTTAGSYADVNYVSVTQNSPVAPEPISSILFVTGGTLLAGKSYVRKRRVVA